jgi:hypothetical protein
MAWVVYFNYQVLVWKPEISEVGFTSTPEWMLAAISYSEFTEFLL